MLRRFLKNKRVLRECAIYRMLKKQARLRHISFHTPGHKRRGADITELAYSDNLSSPSGCIAAAERDIAAILGAHRSFLLTDGSTAGVLAMLYAARAVGVRKIALCEAAHKSVFNGCALTGIEPLLYPEKKQANVPFPYTMDELSTQFGNLLAEADALFFTSPNYYGGVADLDNARAYCARRGKLLLVDGAHGGHLHFTKNLYAGAYADIWVDGVHKSLPALTQAAIVSARTPTLAEELRLALDIFRTTSPSYPVLASAEYAIKYPRNESLEAIVRAAAKNEPRLLLQDDWTKLCAVFGESAFEAAESLEKSGFYPEFCDGNVILFYLSPATARRDFSRLLRRLHKLFKKFPLTEREPKTSVRQIPTPVVIPNESETELIGVESCIGRVCARNFGLFPPCTPLCRKGERITQEHIEPLRRAHHTFGINDGKISVYKTKAKEQDNEKR